ncbi:MAG: PilN domain-containing protein [Phycisphaerae bacterium]|nr:PilN domain-containing protein [Phycisphaerae bacterium]
MRAPAYTTAGTPASLLEGAAREAADKAAHVRAAARRLDAAKRQLAVATKVSDHPDWSLLLALVANLTGEHVTLRACLLTETKPSPASKSDTPPTGAARKPAPLVLTLEGLAADPTDLTELALKLERTGLFLSVDLSESSRETGTGIDAVRFTLACRLKPEGPGS